MTIIFVPDVKETYDYTWYIDIGPFFSRFGGQKLVVLASTDATIQAIIADVKSRKWVDLKIPEVASAIAVIGSKIPAVDAAMQNAILNTPVAKIENYALRVTYFSGQ